MPDRTETARWMVRRLLDGQLITPDAVRHRSLIEARHARLRQRADELRVWLRRT